MKGITEKVTLRQCRQTQRHSHGNAAWQ